MDEDDVDFWNAVYKIWEPAGADPCGLYGQVSLELTTDPDEAPADALLEAAGWDMRGCKVTTSIGDEAMMRNDVRVAYKGPRIRGYAWASQLVHEAAKWWPHAEGYMAGTCAYTLPTPVEDDAPCPKCLGTGRVAGALGVGIEWPCECMGGAW